MRIDDLAGQLDLDFAAVNNRLNSEQRATIKAWQKTDREYQSIQRYLRTGQVTDRQAVRRGDQLADLIRSGRT